MKEDIINHPTHYTKGGIEAIDVIKAKATPLEFQGYLIGTIRAYALRLGLKGNTIDDADKIIWYCNKLKQNLTRGDKHE